ncbi:MAG: tRNA (adenosine(37)-N6)-threonylcarbamoyltransferase complex transferase subunit TsaD [Candidatus Pacebacteria bacterium]|nr:tRNA (adenosine(37)-N6)-threonylcarbamoyltransferase complex transferase subunit TsaD [Candidatus Paceibacterota bacterium]
MLILSIETSCDETAMALLNISQSKSKIQYRVLSESVASQIKLHRRYGGVVPNLASREHAKNFPIILKQTLKTSYPPISFKNLDLIAATIGPGLLPSLLIGVNGAKTLSWFLNKPLAGVNHLTGHLFSFLLNEEFQTSEGYSFDLSKQKDVFPAIGLIVSGGHTTLVKLSGFSKIKMLGETRDDAAGECLDKCARLLNLGYPGGPIIAKLAKNNPKITKVKFPRPMANSDNYDFSFSGLKTAVLYFVQSLTEQEKKELLPQMCYEIQEAVVDVLIIKALKAAREYSAKSLVLGGGVTANNRLREKIMLAAQREHLQLFLPPIKYATDNATIMALPAYLRYHKVSQKILINNWKKLDAKANITI